MAYQDYYAVLGVKKDAGADDIKRAYRELARKHHPDLQPEARKAQAAAKFRQINEAYQVLGDPEKRAKYDRIGPERERERAAQPPPRRPRAADPGAFSDFFEELFGQAGRRGFGVSDAYAAGAEEGEDVEAELPLTLEEAFRGGEASLSIDGRTVKVRLPPHVGDGVKLRLRGQGRPGPRGQRPGDLFLRTRLLPHPRFKVSGSDLETAVTIMPWTAALGGDSVVEALDGPIRIRIPAGTHAGRPFRIAAKGLSRGGDARGDLYAVARIDIPDELSARGKRLLSELEESENP